MQSSPERERFREFSSRLSKYLIEQHPEICFYVFGSVFQNVSYPPNDLDGGIIVPGLITNKEQIRSISVQMARLAEEVPIPLEKVKFNLIDTESSEDGRFLSYDTSYVDYLHKKAKILTITDLMGFLNGTNFRYGTLESAAFNFRKVRNYFLALSHHTLDADYNPRDIEAAILSSLGQLESLPKKLLELWDIRNLGKVEEIVDNKYEAIRVLVEILPKVNLSFFSEIKRLKREGGLESALQDPEQAFRIWGGALTTFEFLIKKYIETYPSKEIDVTTRI